jgi:hypothetical protein
MKAFVANVYVRLSALESLPVTYSAQNGRATMALSFKGGPFSAGCDSKGCTVVCRLSLELPACRELMPERSVPETLAVAGSEAHV